MATPVDIIHAVVSELEAGGLPVHLEPGWEDRGRSGVLRPRGLVLHHTATKAHAEDYPSLGLVRDGKVGLAGPLAQFGIGRHTGTVFVIAAGIANHAGAGGFNGLAGNSSVWGIEAENDGETEAWSDPILRSYVTLAGALARHTGFSPEMICSHKEWKVLAPPDDKKIDPKGIDLDRFRSNVAAFLDTGVADIDVREGDGLAPDERDALLFTGAFLQEVKENKSFVADIVSRLDALDQRLDALSSS